MELLVYNDHCGFYKGNVCRQINSVCSVLVSLNSNVGAIYCVRYLSTNKKAKLTKLPLHYFMADYVSEPNFLCFPCLEKVRTKFPVFPVATLLNCNNTHVATNIKLWYLQTSPFFPVGVLDYLHLDRSCHKCLDLDSFLVSEFVPWWCLVLSWRR